MTSVELAQQPAPEPARQLSKLNAGGAVHGNIATVEKQEIQCGNSLEGLFKTKVRYSS